MGIYDQDLDLTLLLKILHVLDNKIIFDVGAEQGTFIQAFLENGASAIYGFEPYPPNVEVMKNRFRDNPTIRIFEMAIGNRDGQAALHIAHDHHGQPIPYFHSLVASQDSAAIHWGGSITVPVRSLDSMVKAGEIPPQIGILKIDTEGNDFAILQGMGSLSSDVIMIEYWTDLPETVGKCPYKLSEVAVWLQSLGYANFVFVRRWSAFQSMQINSLTERPGAWGNVLFIRNRVFQKVLPIILQLSAETHETLFDKAEMFKAEAEKRLTVIDTLVKENNQLIQNLKTPQFWLRQIPKKLRVVTKRFGVRPRANASNLRNKVK